MQLPSHMFQFDSIVCFEIKSPLDSLIQEERLKTRTMNDLQVDDELIAIVVDDQDTETATTRLEGISQLGPEVGLIDDGKALLDVARFGHCNHCDMLV